MYLKKVWGDQGLDEEVILLEMQLNDAFKVYATKYQESMVVQQTKSTESTEESAYERYMMKTLGTQYSSTENELENYLKLPPETKIDPLKWWQANKKRFPILSLMAKDYLAIQASSVAVEELFSSVIPLSSRLLFIVSIPTTFTAPVTV
ncbi:hypothetical protein HK096_002696 [Nowakowskiella sp. JEL0078]|nr:hypothetical protein HK096_002696 [Nowakowskiella sp. JEL0078]